MRVAVLGAGLAGIVCGRGLAARGIDFFILEREAQIGGLCRTLKTGPYSWDLGVHALYSRHPEAMEYFRSLALSYRQSQRNVRIWHTDGRGRPRLLDYPFEVGIKQLPFKEKLECVAAYIRAQRGPKAPVRNLQEWIDVHCGGGIGRHFMVPYNNKIWNCPLSEISSELVSVKIDPLPVADLLWSLTGRRVVGRAYQSVFLFPEGGIQRLVDVLAKGIEERISLNARVRRLERRRGVWVVTTADGLEREADAVISTLPLTDLLEMTDIEGVKKSCDALRFNDTFFVMVGLKEGRSFKVIQDCHWVFFKEDEIFYRVTLMHNLAGGILPVLVAEITRKGAVNKMAPEEIRERVAATLLEKGIVAAAGDIGQTDIRLVEKTYPILTVGVRRVVQDIEAAMKAQNLFLLGRGGSWRYINMDEVVLSAERFLREHFDVSGSK